MTPLLRVAAVRSGVANWRHSWTGAPTASAGTVSRWSSPSRCAGGFAGDARPRQGRLAALGIDLAAAVVDKVATAHGGDIVAGLATTDLDGAPHDLLVVDNGLILRPCPRTPTAARPPRRILRGVGSDVQPARRHVPPVESRGQAAQAISVRVELTLRDGRTMNIPKWNGEDLAKNSTEVFREAIEQFVTEPAAR